VRSRRLPVSFFALVAAEFLVQPALFVVSAQRLQPHPAGLLLIGLLLLGIARGSRAAWGLLLLVTLLLTVAVAVVLPAGGTLNASGAALTLYNLATLALLLSRSLRSLLRPPRSGGLSPIAR
jgi:hypothetical protein